MSADGLLDALLQPADARTRGGGAEGRVGAASTGILLPVLRAQGGGTVLNISSIAGLRPLPLAGAAYCASKAAVDQLGDLINMEEGKNGIRCTNICPGEIDTPILDRRPQPPSAGQLGKRRDAMSEAPSGTCKLTVARDT